MTANPFAALLDGVPRHHFTLDGHRFCVPDGPHYLRSEVLAALAAAYPADLAEAGKVLAKLQSQIGDDVQDVYLPQALHKLSANTITALLALIAAQEAVNRAQVEVIEKQADTIIRINARAEAAETALAADRAKTAKLVEYYEASEAILSIEAEWRSRKADGLLDGSNIFNLTDKLTAAEARLAKARAAITEAGQ